MCWVKICISDAYWSAFSKCSARNCNRNWKERYWSQKGDSKLDQIFHSWDYNVGSMRWKHWMTARKQANCLLVEEHTRQKCIYHSKKKNGNTETRQRINSYPHLEGDVLYSLHSEFVQRKLTPQSAILTSSINLQVRFLSNSGNRHQGRCRFVMRGNGFMHIVQKLTRWQSLVLLLACTGRKPSS